MSDRMRITGMNSGMDTESIVQQLVAAKKLKVDNIKNDQKKLEWKQTAWQELNTKIYNLYSNTLSKLRLTGAYQKKTTTSSDVTKATVTAAGNAVDGVQTLSINSLAKAGYLTGAQVARYEETRVSAENPSLSTKLADLGIKEGTKIGVALGIDDLAEGDAITIEADETVQSFMDKINAKASGIAQDGVDFLTFDATSGAFKVNVKDGTQYRITQPSGQYDSSVFEALGLSEAFKNDNSVIGSKEGTVLTKPTLVRVDGSAITNPGSAKLFDDLGIKPGSRIGIGLGVADPAEDAWVTVGANDTVNSFIEKINAVAKDKGLGDNFLVLNNDDGTITVKGPADGTKYRLTQGMTKDEYGSAKVNTEIIDVLGLSGVFANDNSVTGTYTGESIARVSKKPAPLTADTELRKIASGMFAGNSFIVKTGAGETYKRTKIELKEDMKISDLITSFRNAGINASFDEANQRFFLSSKATGKDSDFTIEAEGNDKSRFAFEALGLKAGDGDGLAKKINGEDAEIYLNGAKYTSTKNSITVNGLTINAVGVTDPGSSISITTTTDYQGAYDTIKEFLSEYNDLINEIDKLYNADSARKYTMLSSDQKESMSDEEVEKWEGTIKGALLRKDGQLGTIMNTMTSSMMKILTVNGKSMRLADFGIKTLGYFKAKDFERHAYHIDGDKDDELVSSEKDELMKALVADPESTVQFFADLSKGMYESIGKIMNTTSEYSSIYKVYNDKQLKKDYDNYTKKIKDAEDKLSAYEDKWYDKFAKMEKALAKLQSNQSAVTGMMGK